VNTFNITNVQGLWVSDASKFWETLKELATSRFASPTHALPFRKHGTRHRKANTKRLREHSDCSKEFCVTAQGSKKANHKVSEKKIGNCSIRELL